MAITETFFNPDLATGNDDGTTEANAWQTWTSKQAGQVAGDRVNAKNPSSPFQPGANISLAVSATDLLVSIFRGYGSSIGDGTKFIFDMEGTNTLSATGDRTSVLDIAATGSDITAIVSITGDLSIIENANIVNNSTTTNANNALSLFDSSAKNVYCEGHGTGSGSFAAEISRGSFSDSKIKTTRGGLDVTVGFRASAVSNVLIIADGGSATSGLLISGYGSGGFFFGSGLTIDAFTDGVNFTSMEDITGTETASIDNSIIANCTTGIANTDTATKNMAATFKTIAFFNNGTDTELGDNEVQNKISLTANPFNADHSLNNTAGGGADCRAAVLFAGGEMSNFKDIGALQHEDTGGGGSSMLRNAAMTGGMR